ncbi:DUF47 family protein [bacterium]|nr:DUF47 family protein [bacterium]
MGLLSWFLPKERNFYKMLLDQSEKTLEGMKAFQQFARDGKPESAERVKQLEEEADDLRARIMHELNDTFITPIDREDIHTLSRSIDDIIDYAKKSCYEMEVFKIQSTEYIVQMVDVLTYATEQIVHAIANLEKDPKVAAQRAMNAKRSENQVEYIYHRALAKLFESADTIYILKCREVYRHLSNSADHVDQAANIIQDISIKIV